MNRASGSNPQHAAKVMIDLLSCWAVAVVWFGPPTTLSDTQAGCIMKASAVAERWSIWEISPVFGRKLWNPWAVAGDRTQWAAARIQPTDPPPLHTHTHSSSLSGLGGSERSCCFLSALVLEGTFNLSYTGSTFLTPVQNSSCKHHFRDGFGQNFQWPWCMLSIWGKAAAESLSHLSCVTQVVTKASKYTTEFVLKLSVKIGFSAWLLNWFVLARTGALNHHIAMNCWL